MQSVFSRVTLGALMLGLASWAACQPVTGDGTYHRAIEAFHSRHYKNALELFRQLWRTGNSSAQLRYNIAVTEFRLHRYRKARDTFRQLLASPDWRDLAVYNIAVIDERTGRDRAAMRGYRRIATSADNDRLRALAANRRDRLAHILSQQSPKPWIVLLDVTGGYDTNAASVATDLKNRVGSPGDSFGESLAYGQYYVQGKHRDGTRIYGLGYYQKYRDQHDYDIGVYSIGAAHEKPLGAYDTTTGIMIAWSELGPDHLATQTQLTLGGARQFGHHRLKLAYKPSYFAASGQYPQLTGWQQRLQLQWLYSVAKIDLKSTIALEHNDRRNLTEGAFYYNYSPDRAELAFDAKYRASHNVQIEAKIKYIHSDFAHANHLIDADGRYRTATRHSNAVTYTLKTAWDLSTHWSLQGEYRYGDHRDTFALYRYHKQVTKLTVEFVY